MKTLLSDLGTLRGRIFFWLGLAVLPVFWVWWMRPSHFNCWQRRAGWTWTAAYVAALVACRHLLAQRWDHFMVSYPYVAIWLTVALGLWLFVRVRSVGDLALLWVASGAFVLPLRDILSLDWAAWGFGIFLIPLLVALAHLWVKPKGQQSLRPIEVATPGTNGP